MDKTGAADGAMTHVRWLILAMLFAVTTVNYADRATLSIAGTALARDLGLTPITLGYAFSAFGWSYALAQLPHAFGWPMVFWLMGAIGIVAGLAWLKVVDNPVTHPSANAAEIAGVVTVLCCLLVVGDIHRVVLAKTGR